MDAVACAGAAINSPSPTKRIFSSSSSAFLHPKDLSFRRPSAPRKAPALRAAPTRMRTIASSAPVADRRPEVAPSKVSTVVDVDLGNRSYPIYIGSGILDEHHLLQRHVHGKRVLVVTNTTIAPLYLETVTKALTCGNSGISVESVILPDGEKYKEMGTLMKVFDKAVETRLDRRCTFVALGGGVIGDMCGFAAAAFLRGVNFIQIPTTLMAQVDSSVGGKTGINHPLGKNLIGAFYQPQCVLIDTNTLNTLPDRELASGVAEVIKYGLIRDAEFFEWQEKNMEAILSRYTIMSSGHSRDEEAAGEIGWRYATPIDGDKGKLQCNFCGKRIMGGGITRLTQHLVGGYKNVAKCREVPEHDRLLVRSNLEGKKAKTQEKSRRDAMFHEKMWEKEYAEIDDSDEDSDMEYPSDCETAAQRRAYRNAIRESVRSEHERREEEEYARGRPFYERGGGSARITIPETDYPSKKQRGGEQFRRSATVRYIPSQDRKQKIIKGMFGNVREKVGKAISTLFYAHGIPANVASGPFLQHAMDEIAQGGTGVKAPTPHELMNKYLHMAKDDLNQYIAGLKKLWPEYGVTIMCDGWTSSTRRQIINFLVYCDGKIFLKSVDASDRVTDYKYIYGLMVEVVKEVGPDNVVQIVTDNGSNFKKAGERLMKSSRCRLLWTLCVARCIDLILKDFGKRKAVGEVISDARSITTFIYNHSHLLSMMR